MHFTTAIAKRIVYLKESMRALSRHSKERGNLQGAFKEYLSQVQTERHAQIERDQKVPGLSRQIFMQDFFQPFKCHKPKSWYVL
jgi:hypothetical protein